MSWFTFLSGLEDLDAQDWRKFDAMGLYNDDAPDAVRAKWAWRRPVWYALRRLAGVLNETKSVSVLYAERGAMVVERRAEWKYNF